MRWELIFSVDPCYGSHGGVHTCVAGGRFAGEDAAFFASLRTADGYHRRNGGCIGDAGVVIDCDLQDPPELIVEMVARWREGYEVVYAQRRTRAGETIPKRIVAAMGYRVIGRWPRSRFRRILATSVS